MAFLHFLAGLRNPVFDAFFSIITFLGDETCFLVIAILLFWCIDKRGGYYVLITGLVGTIINQGLKLVFRIDRPWVLDNSFEAIESAKEGAGGYSFPSGHTQNIAGTFGGIALFFKKNWSRILSIIVIVLVAFSRMYLGVHTPLDVGVSLIVAAVLVFALYPVFKSEKNFHRAMPYIIGAAAALAIGLMVYVSLLNPAEFTGKDELKNLESGMKNASTLLGCFFGLVLVYPLDRFLIKFETKGTWYAQIVKLVVGFGGVLLIKELMRSPLEALVGLFTPSPIYIARAIRYFLVVAFAGVVWPLTFKFFSKWRVDALDKFGAKVTSAFARKPAHAVAEVAETDTPSHSSGSAEENSGENT